jgi:hypothetical protein
VFSVLRIGNKTSTEASLEPVIDQLHSTNSWSGALKVYSVQGLFQAKFVPGRLFISLFLRVMAKVRDFEAKFPVKKGHNSL